MPIQRWMQSAAGGTIQRLKPGLAMMRSRSRIPVPDSGKSIAVSTAAIAHFSKRLLCPSAGKSADLGMRFRQEDAGTAAVGSIKLFRRAIENVNHAARS